MDGVDHQEVCYLCIVYVACVLVYAEVGYIFLCIGNIYTAIIPNVRVKFYIFNICSKIQIEIDGLCIKTIRMKFQNNRV